MDKKELDLWVKQALQVIAEHPPTAENLEAIGGISDFKELPENKARQKARLKKMFAESQAMDREIARAAREKRAAQAAQAESASKPTPPPRLVRKFPKK